MYLRVNLEDGEATVFAKEPSQEDLECTQNGQFLLFKFENNKFLTADVSYEEPEEEQDDGKYDVEWISV